MRTFGCNAFSYVTKDGVEVMGTRADAPDINLDSKPHPGGAPHCFPQVQKLHCRSLEVSLLLRQRHLGRAMQGQSVVTVVTDTVYCL